MKPLSLHRVRARLLDTLSHALEPDQRDAVLGDLTEVGAGDWATLKGVGSLIARQQARLWLDWRPWLATVTLVLPLSLLVSRLSRHWADGTALYLTTVASGTSFDSLDASVWGAGGDVSLSMVATWVGLNVATLCVWSFAAGWVLAALTGRAVWAVGLLFYLSAILATMTGGAMALPADLARPPSYELYAPFVVAVQFALCIVAPALWGIARRRRTTSVSPAAMLLCLVIVLLTALRTPVMLQTALAISWPLLRRSPDPLVPGLLTCLVGWPMGYMVLATIRTRLMPPSISTPSAAHR